jgi:hypothetical protein
MARDIIDIVLTPTERSLLLRYGLSVRADRARLEGLLG